MRRAVSLAARGPSRHLGTFSIVDTTLREGEQFGAAMFTSTDRIYIAKNLDRMGVDYIEVVNPIASSQAAAEATKLATMGLKAKVLAHTRCHMADVEAAIACGVNGVSMYMATSAALAKHSHGVGIEKIVETARPIIQRVQSAGLEVRFSCEDTFRSNTSELLDIYAAIDGLGVNRVGLADTVGVATPTQVLELTRAVRKVLRPETGIEFHTHNDTGCAVANALMAIEGGATHINTCVLGIGERNGITPLGGFLARMYTLDRDAIKKRYALGKVDHLEKYVAHVCGIKVPFNNYVTGAFAFTHKAGVHTKAIMNDPSSYEVIDPEDFGVQRHVELAHRLTGWNALNNRAQSLGLDVTEDQIKAATTLIKNLADERTVTMDNVDSVLIQLATGPKSASSQFMKWSADASDPDQPAEVRKAAEQAAKAMEAFERAQAAAAVARIKDTLADTRPSLVVRLSGHLFDKAVLNRAMDVLVNRDMDFQFLDIDVPATNEGKTTADIRVWARDDKELADVRHSMVALCQAMSDIADTSIDFFDATGAPKTGLKSKPL